MHPDWIRFLGIAFNVIGSLILAYRVTNLLRSLALVADIHEHNLNVIMNPKPGWTHVFVTGGPEHVKKAKGLGLLIAGFSFILLGLIAQGLATFLTLNTGR